MEVIRDFKPDIVVLLVGTNDLYQPSVTPDSVATDSLALMQALHFECSVKKVIYFPILYRTKPTLHTRYPGIWLGLTTELMLPTSLFHVIAYDPVIYVSGVQKVSGAMRRSERFLRGWSSSVE